MLLFVLVFGLLYLIMGLEYVGGFEDGMGKIGSLGREWLMFRIKIEVIIGGSLVLGYFY